MSDDEVTWLTDAAGRRCVGVVSVFESGKPAVKLLQPDGTVAGVVGPEDAPRLIEKLATGVEFSKLVGDSHFRIDVSEP